MLNIDTVAIITGSLNPIEGGFKASYWHLPGGYDVVNARAVAVWFGCEEVRSRFIKEWADTGHTASLS